MLNSTYSGFECSAYCPDRKIGCRSGCERWARDEAKREKIREARNKDRVSNYYSIDLSIQRKAKMFRKKNKLKANSMCHK